MLKLPEKKKSKLDEEFDACLDEMSSVSTASEEYDKMVRNLERLHRLKMEEKCRKVSPDTKAVIAGNLLGILLILGYEKANVITSKALGFVLKGRV